MEIMLCLVSDKSVETLHSLTAVDAWRSSSVIIFKLLKPLFWGGGAVSTQLRGEA